MSPRWLYLALAVGAALGALLTTAQDNPQPPVSGATAVPFELNGDLSGTCDVTVSEGVVDLVACHVEEG